MGDAGLRRRGERPRGVLALLGERAEVSEGRDIQANKVKEKNVKKW